MPKQDIYYHEKRCIFQLLRSIIPIWRPPLRKLDISRGDIYFYLAAETERERGREEGRQGERERVFNIM